ncbi:MAG TPA: hypothetical protein VLG37_02525 [Candidatus Saccharimonadales bacterium]|nr:hypothetical protein [Candidatus Saccharimonadales bacterium]
MPKLKQKHSKKPKTELDTVYILKLVLYLLVGAQWIRVVDGAGTFQLPIPIGLIVGLLLARHERFQIDRKIEYAVLLIAMFVGFWSQVGLYLRA